MKKTWRSILTLVLVVAMVFGVCAPTVVFAQEGQTSQTESTNTTTQNPGVESTEGGSLDTGWCEIEYSANELKVTLRPDIDALLDTNKQVIKDLILEVIEGAKYIAFKGLEDDIEAAIGKDIGKKDLITYITEVKVDGEKIYGDFGGSDGYVFNTTAIVDIVKALPTASEIANMANEDMKLSYYFEVSTEYGTYDFTLTGVVGGGYDKIRTLARIIADYVDIYVADDGTYTFNLRVPAKFSEYVLKAANSGQFSDSLKEKVFLAFSKDINDVYALYNRLTFDDIIELLESINFEGLLDSEFVKQYIDLTGLTNEEIIAKVRQFEGYFNKLMPYAEKIFAKIPERFKDNTLMDLYYGNGEFGYEGTHTVNIEKVLTAISAEYGPKLAAFIDRETITASVDINISFDKINSVQYVVNGEMVREGFLPVGADVAFFSGVTEAEGRPVLAWVDEQGNVITEMPDKDVVLTAVFSSDFDILISGAISKTYDATDSEVKVVVSGSSSATYVYEWYKNGAKIDITTDSFNVKNVKDSGTYYCVVTVTDGTYTTTLTSDEVVVDIAKAFIDKSTVSWDYTDAFTYDGTEKTVLALGLPAGVTALYSGNTGIKASNYTAIITALDIDASIFDTENYELDADIVGLSIDWTISRLAVDVSGIKWNYTGAFIYDGTAKSVTIDMTTVPEGVVLGAYTENEAINVGSYTASVTVNPENENYTITGTVPTQTWEIALGVITIPELTWSGKTFEYDGTEKMVEITNLPAGVTATYTSNKATNANTYTATVTLTSVNPGYSLSITSATYEWEITKKVVDMSGVYWDYTAPLVYNTLEQAVVLLGTDTLPAGFGFTVAGNTATVVGEYTATATLTYDSTNYKLTNTDGYADLTWYITKQTIDMSEVVWDYYGALVYSGYEQGVYLAGLPYDLPLDFAVNYTGNTATVVGNYTATVSFAYDSDNYELVNVGDIYSLSWDIEKMTINLSYAYWDYFEALVYNGQEQSVTLAGLPYDLPLDFVVNYTGNTATTVGEYTASVTFAYDTANFEVIGFAAESFTWEIVKADVDLSGIKFPDVTVEYDGNAHKLEIVGTLPSYVTVTYSANEFVNMGVYVVTATFTVTDTLNYNEYVAPMSATLTIKTRLNRNYEYKDTDGNLILGVNSLKGVRGDYDFIVNDTSHVYTGFELPDGLYGRAITAYDIGFALGGVYMPVENDTFTVTMLLPEAYRQGYDLKVVYVDDDGNVELHDATILGDYIVFETTHFSTYAVVSIEPAPVEAEPADYTWLWILIIILVILLIIALILFFIFRGKNKGNDEPTDEPAPTVEPETEDETPAEETIEEPVVEEPVVEEIIEEPVVEEPVVEEPAPVVEEPVITEPVIVPITLPGTSDEDEAMSQTIIDGEVVYVRYRSSFESRLIQSDNDIQDYYTVIKNKLMSYKGVKSRTSWNFESFNKGRIQCAKLNIKGRTLLLYINLDPSQYSESKYHFTDVSDKPKFEKVPMMLKVRSERALKYTIELIEEMMRILDIPETEAANVDYHMPYETTEALAKRGLVKVILPPGMTLDENSNIVRVNVSELLDGVTTEKPEGDNVIAIPVVVEPVAEEPVVEEIAEPVEEPAEEAIEEPVVEETIEEAIEEPVAEEITEELATDAPTLEEPIFVDADTADEILTDEEATAKIEVVHTGANQRKGKLVEINLDTICENFEDGETVTVEELKARSLISKRAARIKVLARGIMDKKLTVIASKYSLAAVKMITLAGGIAEIED